MALTWIASVLYRCRHIPTFSVLTFSTHFLVPKMSAELTWAHLSPAQTLRQWSQFTRRCVRAWGGPWWWPAGCWEPTRRACCGSSGCCQTGCSTPEPSTPREMRRSTPFAAWIEMAGGSTPVMSSTRRGRGNAPSRLQVGRAGWWNAFQNVSPCIVSE